MEDDNKEQVKDDESQKTVGEDMAEEEQERPTMRDVEEKIKQELASNSSLVEEKK